MNKLDVRDWFVMVMLAGLAAVGCVYIFKFPSPMVFGVWGTVVGSLTAAVHWVNVSDDKKRDE